MPRFYFRIVGSCNGLLCLSDDLFGYTNTVILWNPAIKRKLTLPIPSFMLEQVSMNMVVLGFGFDCKNDDYKVVRIGYFQGDNVTHKVDVYTVKGRAWRGIGGPPPRYRIVEYYWSQAFVNGVVHWVAYHWSEGLGSKLNCLIMSFDMRDEVFNEMLLPEELVHKSPMNMFTAKIGESLALFQCDRLRWSECCSIWVMKEYGVVESWSKLFTADVDGCFIPVGIPLGVRNNLEILVAAARSGELISYDPRIRQGMNLGIIGTRYSFYVDMYAESLALFLEGEKVSAWLELSSESDSSEEEEDDDNDGVEKTEFWIHSTMIQYLTALLSEH